MECTAPKAMSQSKSLTCGLRKLSRRGGKSLKARGEEGYRGHKLSKSIGSMHTDCEAHIGSAQVCTRKSSTTESRHGHMSHPNPEAISN